jgi:pyruvate dehydrogenase E1 component alpha subunit
LSKKKGPSLTREELLRIYHEMLLVRRFEDRAGYAYTQDKIGGYLHLYIGQEATGSGFISALRPDDPVCNAYRDHGHYLSKGGDPKAGMAELFGKVTGCSGGKGGSMHLYDRAHHFYGGTGIVGAGIGIGTGLGFAIKYRGGDQVCLTLFGDGAVNTGLFHESLNMAALWELPILYVCENNLYAMGTSVERSHAVTQMVERAVAYGIEAEAVDGMDFFACREVADRMVAAIRKDKQPRFVEAITYRYRGHGAADPGTYRSREEVEKWRERDPIALMEQRLLADGVLKEEEIQQLHSRVQAEVDEILDFAEKSPPPPPDALYQNVFANGAPDASPLGELPAAAAISNA